MKIDVFTHVQLPRYKRALYKFVDRFPYLKGVQDKRPALTDIQVRLQKLEPYPDMTQVLTATLPPLEEVVDATDAAELARICNDEIAEFRDRYPQRFIAAVANVPLNNPDIALRETERAIKELGCKGIQIHTPINGEPMTSAEMTPLYELMAKFDLPIWIHPVRGVSQPDYPGEKQSFNQIFSLFGWPFETTAAMTRLVFAGIFEKFPNLKLITHHCGGMVPFFAGRIFAHYTNGLERLGVDHFPGLTRHPIEYFRMFYTDTAINGNPSALACGLEFFGEDRLLFGTDMPYDVGDGALSISEAVKAIDAMGASAAVKQKIYEDNARKLMHLEKAATAAE